MTDRDGDDDDRDERGSWLWRLLVLLYTWLTSYNFRIGATALSGVLSFLPLFTNEIDHMEDTLSARSLRDGKLYYESSIVLLALAIPVFLDTMCDAYNTVGAWRAPQGGGRINIKSKEMTSDTSSMTIPEKVLLIIGMVIQPSLAFVPTTTSNFMMLWLCCRRAQQLLVHLAVLVSWCRLFPKVFPPLSSGLSMVCFAAGQLVSSYIINEGSSSSPPPYGTALTLFSNILSYTALFHMLLRALVWLFKTGWVLTRRTTAKETFSTSRLTSGADANDGEQRDHEKNALFFPFVYIAVGTIGLGIIAVVKFTVGVATQQTNTSLMINNIVYTALELGLLLFYLRRVKFEAINNLYALLQSKRSFVRYIK